jgi:hypothetical protein
MTHCIIQAMDPSSIFYIYNTHINIYLCLLKTDDIKNSQCSIGLVCFFKFTASLGQNELRARTLLVIHPSIHAVINYHIDVTKYNDSLVAPEQASKQEFCYLLHILQAYASQTAFRLTRGKKQYHIPPLPPHLLV